MSNHSGKQGARESSGNPGGSSGEPRIEVRPAREDKPQRCSFPGPRGAQSPLRVAIDRSAQAEIIAHAKESLKAEICGVLAGRVCEDDEGLFVHVEAAIRGAAATESSTQVTFTQATWTAIHQTLERDFPKLKIIGWYHSHPGYGVEFSEMDVFIQKNFFPSPTQIALVTDPLNGAVAICINGERGIEYLPRFWVDGREQECRMPATAAATGPGRAGAVQSGDQGSKLQEMEARISQLVVTVDDLRTSIHRFLMFSAVLVCVGILAVAGYGIYLQLQDRVEPPQNIGFAPIPVAIGDHTAILGVNVVSWELPPELDLMRKAIDEAKKELEKEAALLSGTNSPAKTNRPAATNLPAAKTTTKP